jgi:hypothetical protein
MKRVAAAVLIRRGEVNQQANVRGETMSQYAVSANDKIETASAGVRRARAVLLWIIWTFLTATWIATMIAMSLDGDYIQWFQAAAVVFLLYVLSVAEGLELAVTDLLDKQPEQLRDPKVRAALSRLQRRSAEFFSNRQVFVVTIITFSTLMTNYPWIYVPLVGRVVADPIPALFGFLLTTLNVLWFAQVTPKRLAIINSETFLRQALFLLPLIDFVGWLGIPAASDQLVRLFERYTQFGQKRHLQPSSSAYYNATSLKSGLSLDRIDIEVEANADGSGVIRRRSVACFIQGRHIEHSESLYAKTGLSAVPQVKVLGAYTGLPPERLETMVDDLDAILASPEGTGRFERILHWPHVVNAQRDPDALYGGEWGRWSIISGRPLPEAYWQPDKQLGDALQPIVVLAYEVEIHVEAGSLIKSDNTHTYVQQWPEFIEIPTRALRFAIKGSHPEMPVTLQGCDVTLVRTNRSDLAETTRCGERAIAAHDGRLEINYPQQGATYSLHWWQMGGAIPLAPLAKEQVPALPGGTDNRQVTAWPGAGAPL